MKPVVTRYRKNQTYRMPAAAAEVWEPVEHGVRLLDRLALALESIDAGVRLTPIRCVILALIGRQSGIGITAGRIAKVLQLPRATLTHHLKALGEPYLIAQSHHRHYDGRKKLLVLTDAGAAALDRAAELLVEITTGDAWPGAAHARHYHNQRRVPPTWKDVEWRSVRHYLGEKVAPVTTEPPPDRDERYEGIRARSRDRLERGYANRGTGPRRPRRPGEIREP